MRAAAAAAHPRGRVERERVPDAVELAAPAAGRQRPADARRGRRGRPGRRGSRNALGDGRGGLPGQVERRRVLRRGRRRAAPRPRVGADVVARVDDQHDDRLRERVLPPDVQLVQVGGAPRGDPPVDAPEPVAGRERVHVAQPAALAGPARLVRAGQPAQPRRQREARRADAARAARGPAGTPTGAGLGHAGGAGSDALHVDGRDLLRSGADGVHDEREPPGPVDLHPRLGQQARPAAYSDEHPLRARPARCPPAASRPSAPRRTAPAARRGPPGADDASPGCPRPAARRRGPRRPARPAAPRRRPARGRRPPRRSSPVERDQVMRRRAVVGPGRRARAPPRRPACGAVPVAHACGVRDSRCASAGTATALTSSGVTKSRPSRTASERATSTSACDPRGDAPTSTASCARVAAARSTQYRRMSASTVTASTPACIARSVAASTIVPHRRRPPDVGRAAAPARRPRRRGPGTRRRPGP